MLNEFKSNHFVKVFSQLMIDINTLAQIEQTSLNEASHCDPLGNEMLQEIRLFGDLFDIS